MFINTNLKFTCLQNVTTDKEKPSRQTVGYKEIISLEIR